ncbi:MAG TPA: hypothetical protein VHW03_10090 [Chthoniobacterales bacterium]|nr:hypothetical protein [Chthoniobacterales bacterium]
MSSGQRLSLWLAVIVGIFITIWLGSVTSCSLRQTALEGSRDVQIERLKTDRVYAEGLGK